MLYYDNIYQSSLIKSLVFDEPDNFVGSSPDFVGFDVVSSKVYYQVSNIITRISEIRETSITKHWQQKRNNTELIS